MSRTIIPSGEWIYRYDLSQPLAEWSSGYKNPEYEFPNGNKNLFGGFFFFDSEQQAENTGRKAFKRILEEHHYDGYMFNEANGMPGTNTLCFLSSDKLSRPEIRAVNP